MDSPPCHRLAHHELGDRLLPSGGRSGGRWGLFAEDPGGQQALTAIWRQVSAALGLPDEVPVE
ncbi:hypothetical protein ACQPXS_04740 [Streptomyces sp. CA-142005]|uniref:hypothetical protein n=1 Tax=Streptomyces sp. CA-142005 TaxID=3240052 RepID=UPI003D9263D3